jgi:NAD-dependent deacetylase
MAAVLARVRAGEHDPACLACGGILKSDTISFGQPLVPDVVARAMQAATQADCLIAVGTTLRVFPVATAVPAAKSAGAAVIIVNAEPTAFDEVADVRLSGSIAELLPSLLLAS